MLRALLLLLLLAVAALPLTPTLAQSCPSLTSPICTADSHCAGNRCVRGVCQCATDRYGETCAGTAEPWLQFGNVVVTQPGIDYAPQRYFAPIQQAFDQAKARGALNMSTYDGPCTNANNDPDTSYKVTVLPIPTRLFSRADLLPATVRFTITATGLYATAGFQFEIKRAKLDLYGGSGCCPCSGSGCKRGYCAQVCSSASPSDWIDFSFRANVGAKVDFAYSSSAPGLVASVGQVDVTFDDDSLGAQLTCPTSSASMIADIVKDYFGQMKTQIAPTLAPLVKAELQLAANAIVSRYQGVQHYQPQPGLFVAYKVMNLTVSQGKWISVDVQGKVTHQHFTNQTSNAACLINNTYVDTAGDAQLLPPRVWGPIDKWLMPSGLISPILAGLRMSRSTLNALAWAEFQRQLGRRHYDFTYTAPGTALAATGQVDISVPYFKIPQSSMSGTRGVLKASVSGKCAFSCAPSQTGTVLGFNFAQLDGTLTLAYDDRLPSVVYQLEPNGFELAGAVTNIVAPNTPELNNAALLKSAMVGALNFNLDAISRFLRTQGQGVLVLPADLQALFPDAQINIHSQQGQQGALPGGESGYIEMIHRCACSSSPRPIANQGVDGTVSVCPAALLDRDYCRDLVMRRRRLSSSEEERRELSTPQQDADLATVLGLVVGKCVTKAPTLVPTMPRPTVEPTLMPSRKPTPPSVTNEENASPCEETSQCEYKRDVLMFVCDEGREEVKACRRENSDIYCCWKPGYVKASGGGSFGGNSWILTVAVVVLGAALN